MSVKQVRSFQVCVVAFSQVVNLGAEAALAQRDLSIREYFDAQVANLVAKPEVRDKVMTLAREVRRNHE